MNDYSFEERYRWSDKEIIDRVYQVASKQLGATDVKRAGAARLPGPIRPRRLMTCLSGRPLVGPRGRRGSCSAATEAP